jgi:type IV secretory pathway VirJ component
MPIARRIAMEESARLGSALALLTGALIGISAHSAEAEHLTHGRFADIAVYAPLGTPKSFVLLLSGDEGLSSGLTQVARALVRHGAMVAASIAQAHREFRGGSR